MIYKRQKIDMVREIDQVTGLLSYEVKTKEAMQYSGTTSERGLN